MVPAPQDVTINALPYPYNCLQWHGEHLVLVTARSVRLIQASVRSSAIRPQEIEPSAEELANESKSCTTRDLISLAESSELRIVQAASSPAGATENNQRCIAVLTAGNRVGVYVPTRDPDKDPWKLLAVLPTTLSDNQEPEHSASYILRARVSCIKWTQPFGNSRRQWGDTFLIIGNAAGEVKIFNRAAMTEDAAYTFSCSEHKITRIEAGPVRRDNSVIIVVADLIGSLFLVTCQIQETNGNNQVTNVEAELLDQGKTRKCMNLTMYLDNKESITIAAAFAGCLDIFYYNPKSKTKKLTYNLAYAAPTSGLSFFKNGAGDLRLIALSLTGKVIVLVCTHSSASLEIDNKLTSLIMCFASDRLRHNSISAPVGERYEIAFHGLDLSTNSIYAAISYSLAPIDRVRYSIPAHESSRVGTVLLSEDLASDLKTLLATFLVNPYKVSITEIVSTFKLSNMSVLPSLDRCVEDGLPTSTVQPNDLRALSYDAPDLNVSRIKLVAALGTNDEVRNEAEGQLRYAHLNLVMSASLATHLIIGSESRSMLLRMADYISLHLHNSSHNQSDPPLLLQIARNVYALLGDSGVHYATATDTGEDGGSAIEVPSRDACFACKAPIYVSPAPAPAPVPVPASTLPTSAPPSPEEPTQSSRAPPSPSAVTVPGPSLANPTISSSSWSSSASASAAAVSGACTNGHVWPRCSVTFAPLGTQDCRSCLTCHRRSVLPLPPRDSVPPGSKSGGSDASGGGRAAADIGESHEDEFMKMVMETFDLCFYCTGKWCNQ